MTANFEVINGKLRVVFWYQADLDKTQAISEDAAEYLWNTTYGQYDENNELLPFDDLTNQEKLDLVDLHVKQVILDLSNTFKSMEAQEVARLVEAENPHEFD